MPPHCCQFYHARNEIMCSMFKTAFIKSRIELSLCCGAAVRPAINVSLGLLLLLDVQRARRIIYEKQMTDEHTALFI